MEDTTRILIEQRGDLKPAGLAIPAILSLAALLSRLLDFMSPMLDRVPARRHRKLTAIAATATITTAFVTLRDNLLFFDLVRWSMIAGALAIPGIFIYALLSAWLRIEAGSGRSTKRVLKLHPDTVAVLDGTYKGSNPLRNPPTHPPDFREYFRLSGNNEPFIWTNGSRILSSTLLGLPYFIGVGALMISLGFLGIALSRGPVWMTISDIVQFDTGEATVTETGEQILVQVAGDIRRFRARRVEIIGYADSRGGEESNQDLSEARARAVAAYLRDADTGASFVTIGKGEEEAEEIEKGLSGEARRKAQAWNRRVEFRIIP